MAERGARVQARQGAPRHRGAVPPGARRAARALARASDDLVRALPSGRTVRVCAGTEERLEIRSPEGELEVSIRLTEAGPEVRVRGARLELEAAGEVRLGCRRFEVQAEEGARLASAGELELVARGEMRLQACEDVRVQGKIIRLN